MANSIPDSPYSGGPASEQIAKIREMLLMMASLANRNLALALLQYRPQRKILSTLICSQGITFGPECGLSAS